MPRQDLTSTAPKAKRARNAAPRDPVTIRFDGAPVVAERGEPIAISLVAAGHLALARSPKFHRPRGPSCLRGACDGCLARVDEIPNVMTCRTPADEGTEIVTQNVVGTGGTDLLRAADWLFPEGMNHHELWAGVPGVQRILQRLARRISGLGRLPRGRSTGVPATPPRTVRRDVDVLVVGCGPSGMAAALQLTRRGRRVEVIDDALDWGGGAAALRRLGAPGWDDLYRAFEDELAAGRISLRLRTTAAGIYGEDVLIANPNEGVDLVTARTLVLAPGAHDGVLPFEGNDLPGVMSARAACHFAARGVGIGKPVVVTVLETVGPFGAAYARTHGVVAVRGVPVRVRGRARVKSVTVATAEGEIPFACDALVVDAPGAPAYEVCAQAGAEPTHGPAGFRIRAPGGKIRDGVFALGEVVGTALEPDAIAGEAMAVCEHIAFDTLERARGHR